MIEWQVVHKEPHTRWLLIINKPQDFTIIEHELTGRIINIRVADFVKALTLDTNRPFLNSAIPLFDEDVYEAADFSYNLMKNIQKRISGNPPSLAQWQNHENKLLLFQNRILAQGLETRVMLVRLKQFAGLDEKYRSAMAEFAHHPHDILIEIGYRTAVPM